jgi:hypothetical protein
MSVKTFEIVVRVEVETPDKTEPNMGDAFVILDYACQNVYNKDSGVAINAIRIDSVTECDEINFLEA